MTMLQATHEVPGGRLLIEPASPFVPRAEEPYHIPEPDDARPLLVDLLGAPERVVERLVDAEALERAILGSLGGIAAGTALFAVIMMLRFGWTSAIRAGVLSSTNGIIALAASLGPIYAAGLLVAARLPLARLVGALLTSAATGAMVLAAMTPIPYFLMQVDAEWLGPLAVVASFGVSALVAGGRIYRTLMLLAGDEIDEASRARVAILARVAMMIFAFTSALALWGFDALVFVG